MKMPCLLILTLLLLASSLTTFPCLAVQPGPSPVLLPGPSPVLLPGPSPAFLEDFRTADAVAGRWEEVTNGGTLRVSEHRLALSGDGGKGFPVLTTRTSPFPRTGDWTVSFGYRYASIGNYGTDLSCDQADGSKIIMIHQDVNDQVLALNGVVLARMPANRDWHVISVAKAGSHVTAFVDGKEVGGGDLGILPTAIRLGGSLQTAPWDWNDLQIQFVRVDAGLHPLSIGTLQTLPVASPTDASAPGRTPPDNDAVAKKPSALDNLAAPNYLAASDKATPAGLLEEAKPEEVKYKIVNLGAFPIALHTNWFLELEISNESNVTLSAVDMQLDLLFGDASKLPLTIYDPDKSYPAGNFLQIASPSPKSYDIKAHTKRLFYAYNFDSALISDNYYGQAHRVDSLIVTAGSKRVAMLMVHGF